MPEPLDLTNLFNTPLTPAEEAQFQAWATKAGRLRDTFDYDLRGAWKADAQAAANGHLPDTWKKPNHPTFSVESQYNGVEGMQGGRWLQDGKRWMFLASPHNRQNLGETGLHDYFRRVEPDAQLIFPGAGALAGVR